PGPANLYDVTPPRGALDAVSRTFHGRDVFAPLAAQLATGVAPAAIGTFLPLEQAVRLPDAGPAWRPDGALAVRVLHVDRFGNCILNVPAEPWRDALAAWGSLAVRLADGTVFPAVLAETYAVLPSRDVLGVLAGSQGHLELALDRDSAARRLGLHPGDALHLVSGETL
ncbi:MAG: SAM-dependent chlorinase/fluorinase, partial [Desulfovibrio sp.]|nr:SAM-dependent chlorinase/fluorinase [Desulfovibrio sp.]